jgi:hypothetical protein
MLSVEDSTSYRQNPLMFLELSYENRLNLVESVTGPLENVMFGQSSWPKSKFRRVSPYDQVITDEKNALDLLLATAMAQAKYSYVAALMIFFQIECNANLLYLNDYGGMRVLKYFEFGCFEQYRPLGVSNNIDFYEINEAFGSDSADICCYLFGIPFIYLFGTAICETENIRDSQFAKMCQLAETMEYSGVSVHAALKDENCEDQVDPIVLQSPRLKTFLLVLNKQRFVDALLFDELQYACHLKYYYSTDAFMSDKFNIPAPKWSRASHKQLAFEGFSKIAQTIIAMQKFRYQQFPLHKDLTDTLLGFIFDSYVAELDFECQVRYHSNRYFKEYPYPELAVIALKYGIYIPKSNKGVDKEEFNDAIRLELGGTLPDSVMVKHRKHLEWTIVKMPGCKDIIDADLEKRIDNDPKLRKCVGETILKYCVEKEVPIWYLDTGRWKLTNRGILHGL